MTPTTAATIKPTREQKLIINHLHGHAIVKASPGCTKTSTLGLLRAKHLIETGCDPRKIVILTYGKALTLDIAETLSQLLTLSFINSSLIMVYPLGNQPQKFIFTLSSKLLHKIFADINLFF